jgi:hypothetical protein
MIPEKPNPAGKSRAGNDMLGGSSQFSDSNIDWRTQLIASRHFIPQNLAPIYIALAFGENQNG